MFLDVLLYQNLLNDSFFCDYSGLYYLITFLDTWSVLGFRIPVEVGLEGVKFVPDLHVQNVSFVVA